MLDRLRRFDVQATYARALALASVAPCAAAAYLINRNFRSDVGQIIYGSRGMFVPSLLSMLAVSMFLSAPAFVLGWSSAGQRRNETPGRSWVGFFVGGAVLTVDVILLLAFYLLRLEQPN